MTGARVGENPWISLAAKIIEQAQDDCKGIGHINQSSNSTIIKALIQYDAERWLRFHPWCQFLLDCSLPWEYDIHQSAVAFMAKKLRKKCYTKHLPRISAKEEIPAYTWEEMIGLNKTTITRLVDTGKLEGTYSKCRGNGQYRCVCLSELARGATVGVLPGNGKRKRKRSQ